MVTMQKNNFLTILPIFEGFWGPTVQWVHIKGRVIHQNDRLIKPYQDQKKKKYKKIRNHGNQAGNIQFLTILTFFSFLGGPMHQWKHI